MKRSTGTLLITMACLFFAGCGGGGGSSDSTNSNPDNDEAEPVVNAAAQANGGVASANYNKAHADLVNDGDTNPATFWAGNATGDYVTVAFSQEHKLGEVNLFTNRLNTSDTEILLSTDGNNFDSVSLPGDCELGITIGSGQVACFFHPERTATHIRVKITDPSTPGSVEIHEIKARGFVEK